MSIGFKLIKFNKVVTFIMLMKVFKSADKDPNHSRKEADVYYDDYKTYEF